MPYIKQRNHLLELAQRNQLFRTPDGSFSRTDFDREFRHALEWAIEEYEDPQPFPAHGIWHDFIQHRVGSSVWKYCFGPRSNGAYLRLGGFPGTAPEDPRDQPGPPASSRDLAIHHSPEPRASSSRRPSHMSRSQRSRRPIQLPQPSTQQTNRTYSVQIGRTQLSSRVPSQPGPPQGDQLLTDQRPIRESFTSHDISESIDDLIREAQQSLGG
ncbi:hypothetical protein V8E51_016698 [Hyaloscypha variabilis]